MSNLKSEWLLKKFKGLIEFSKKGMLSYVRTKTEFLRMKQGLELLKDSMEE